MCIERVCVERVCEGVWVARACLPVCIGRVCVEWMLREGLERVCLPVCNTAPEDVISVSADSSSSNPVCSAPSLRVGKCTIIITSR